MEYNSIIDVLLCEFPELQTQFAEDKHYLDGLPHLVFENIFVPYIKDIIGRGDAIEIEKAFRLIESMITCPNERVQEVAVVSVLEPLVFERELVAHIKRYFRRETADAFKIIENTFGWTE